MSLSIQEKLNPICEVLGLIYFCQNKDKLKKRIITELSDNGINGEVFYKKNFKIFDKYISEFSKNMIIEQNELFSYEGNNDMDIFLVIMITLIKNPYLITSFNEMEDKEIRNLILEIYYDSSDVSEQSYELNVNTLDEILEFVEKEDLKEKDKWILMKILSKPKETIRKIVKAYENNKSSYEQACKSIDIKLDKLIKQNKKYIESGKCDIIKTFFESEEEFKVIPTLILGGSVLACKDILIFGVLNEKIFKEMRKNIGSKGDLVLKLKSLSDNSKLEIISLLKERPMYGLELVEKLKLTSATVSYHMNALLEVGLILVNKKKGKIYYSLNSEAIEKFINELSNTLL